MERQMLGEKRSEVMQCGNRVLLVLLQRCRRYNGADGGDQLHRNRLLRQCYKEVAMSARRVLTETNGRRGTN